MAARRNASGTSMVGAHSAAAAIEVGSGGGHGERENAGGVRSKGEGGAAFAAEKLLALVPLTAGVIETCSVEAGLEEQHPRLKMRW